MQMFLNAPADDEDAREFLPLKRKQALKRLQAELQNEDRPCLCRKWMKNPPLKRMPKAKDDLIL